MGGDGPDYPSKEVGVKVVEHALQYRGDALEAHARVDARLWKWVKFSLFVAVELHEHKVP